MALWLLQHDADGQKTVMFKDKSLYATAGRCSAATPDSMIVEWIVKEAEPGDVIVTEEGSFVMPFRVPTKLETRC